MCREFAPCEKLSTDLAYVERATDRMSGNSLARRLNESRQNITCCKLLLIRFLNSSLTLYLHATMSVNVGESNLKGAAKPRKRFVGSKSSKPSKPGVQSSISNQIPQDILQDTQLNAAIAQLPSNYSFEIHKTIHHVRKNNATMVALQMPEGLQMFACTIADIIEKYVVDSWRQLHSLSHNALGSLQPWL